MIEDCRIEKEGNTYYFVYTKPKPLPVEETLTDILKDKGKTICWKCGKEIDIKDAIDMEKHMAKRFEQLIENRLKPPQSLDVLIRRAGIVMAAKHDAEIARQYGIYYCMSCVVLEEL